MKIDISEIIKKYNLQSHPEGGYFNETYRSDEYFEFLDINSPRFNSKRSLSTQIIYCVPKNIISKLHKIKSDETWHFYYGDPFILNILDFNLNLNKIVLGNSLEHLVQFTVPRGYWFCGEPLKNESYSLMGCSVSPGFEFEDFELPSEDLKQEISLKYSTQFERFL